MRHWFGIAVAVAVGLVAVAAPILVSVELSWREGLGNERDLTLSYAADALSRTDQIGREMLAAISRLSSVHDVPCSTADVNLMRRIDVGSTYIQALGRIHGNVLTCTSLGTTQPVSLGPPDFTTQFGTAERLNVHLPFTDSPVVIISRNGFAFLLDPRVPVDTPTEGPRISIALFEPSSPDHPIIASRNPAPLRPEWFRTVAPGASTTFRSGGYIIAIDRSSMGDIAALTAAPESYVINHVRRFALLFIPLGLLGAILLAWAVAHFTRIQLSMPAQLRAAARRGEFYVEYQPIVDLETRRCIGAEALVRWRRSNGQIAYPDSFIGVAEDSGVIPKITACVANIVAEDLPSLLAIAPDFSLSINLSAIDLRTAYTVTVIRNLLTTSRARPQNIKIEATERGVLQSKDATGVVSELRSLGIEFAIDDFGTGYSSLSRVQTMDANILKIDKDFVDAIESGSETGKLVDHIIDLANTLHLVAVAEGVETEAQALFLQQRGVRFAQGWLFAKPMKITHLRNMLEAQASPAEEILA